MSFISQKTSLQSPQFLNLSPFLAYANQGHLTNGITETNRVNSYINKL